MRLAKRRNGRSTPRGIGLLACLALVLSACGGGDGESSATEEPDDGATESSDLSFLRLGDPSTVRPIFEPILAEFENANEGVEVSMVDMGFGEFRERLPQMFSVGNAPDVQLVNQNYLYSGIENEQYLPLNDYISEELRARIPERLWEAATVDGNIYYVPASVGAFVLWYNADLFTEAGLDPESPPTTWDELKAAAAQIEAATDATGIGIPAAAADGTADIFSLWYAAASGERPFIGNTNEASFQDEEGRETLSFLQGLMEEGLTQGNEHEYVRQDLQPGFRDGSIAMTIDGPWILSTLEEAHDLSSLDSTFIRTAPMPVRDPNGESAAYAGVEGWSIASSAENPELAWELIEWLVEPENQLAHSAGYGVTPIQQEVFEMGDFGAPHWQTLQQAVEDAVSRPKSPDAFALNQVLVDLIQDALVKGEDPTTAIQSAADAAAAQ